MAKNKKKPVKSYKTVISFYSQLIANLSQIILVLLAIFGYFYTIRPIYQNQFLNEENAKLQNENNTLRNENIDLQNQYQNDLVKIKNELADLENQVILKNIELNDTNAELTKIKEANTQSQLLAESIVKRIKINNSLLLFKNELIQLSKNRQKILFDLLLTYSSFQEDYLGNLEYNEIDNFINEYFINPIIYINDGINLLNSKYANQYYDNADIFFGLCKKS